MSTILQRIARWEWSTVLLSLTAYVASVWLVLIGSLVYLVTTYGLLSSTDPVLVRVLLFVVTLPASLIVEPLYRLRIVPDNPWLLGYVIRPLLNALALITVIGVAKHSTAKAKRTPSQ